MTDLPKIRFRDVTKRFMPRRGGGEVEAITSLSLDIAEKQFVCIVGPSGCGKSTQLNMLAGFEHPSSGEVLLDGTCVTEPGPDRGVVFQDGALFPWLNVLDNVCFGPRRQGLSRRAYRPAAMAILEQVGLRPFAGNLPSELSGGMRQRLAIARALVNRPPILLMDEPFGALDPQTRLLMQELLLSVWEQEHRTVLFVTHDVDEALFLADRVIVMSRRPGRVLEDIRVDLERPREYRLLTSDRFTRLKVDVLDLVRREALSAAYDAEHAPDRV
jgi:ABC-type nitrate/sulfonate/bicarbonate transport system ATPase subunit